MRFSEISDQRQLQSSDGLAVHKECLGYTGHSHKMREREKGQVRVEKRIIL